MYEDPSASRLRPNRDEAGDRMYTITEDPGKRLLIMALSGRVDTDEALRALSQALTLSETDAISAVVCDVTAVQRGPASLIRIAAGLALGYRPGMRIALLSGDQQRATATRFARFSGLRDGVRVFASADDAQAWVAPAALPARPTGRLIARVGGRIPGARRAGTAWDKTKQSSRCRRYRCLTA